MASGTGSLHTGIVLNVQAQAPSGIWIACLTTVRYTVRSIPGEGTSFIKPPSRLYILLCECTLDRDDSVHALSVYIGECILAVVRGSQWRAICLAKQRAS